MPFPGIGKQSATGRDETPVIGDEQRQKWRAKRFWSEFSRGVAGVASRHARCRKVVLTETKIAASATSNPQLRSMRSRALGNETAERSTARYDAAPAPTCRHRARPRYGLRWPVVFAVATLLAAAVLRAGLQLHPRRSGSRRTHWSPLVILNATYWYVWALFTPVDHLALAALPVRAAGPVARHPRPRAVGRRVLVRAHRRRWRACSGGWRRDSGRLRLVAGGRSGRRF